METKETLLKNLGFSDGFLKELGNNPYDNNFENSDKMFTCFDTVDTGELDLTSLIIEKTEVPLNLNVGCITK